MQEQGPMDDEKFGGRSSSRFESFGRKVDEHFNQALPRVEEEVKKVITYLNDQVVPQLRQGSAQALFSAADQLKKLAEQLEDRGGAK
jgi:hypothetical protein